MSKKMNKLLCLLVSLVGTVTVLSAGVACGGNSPSGESQNSQQSVTENPTITVNGVPTSGIVGRAVTVPAATATDALGADISVKVKVTVAGLKENGEVGKEFIYNQTANVERTFTPTSAYATYKITYTVKDDNGKSATVEYDFTAVADSEKPVITVTEAGFNISEGISCDVFTGIRLPAVSALDQPGDVDITAAVRYTLVRNGTAVATGAYAAGKSIYVSDAGNYTLSITVSDSAGNASDAVAVPVAVADADLTGKNILTPDRVVIGYDSYINEYGELCVGKNMKYGHGDDNPASATLAGKKFAYGEYVGISVNMDKVPASAGEVFYQIAFAMNRSDGVVPSGNECVWPEMFDIRFEATKTGVRGSNAGDGTDAGADAGKAQQIGGLRDGQDHQIYLKLVKTGASANAADAKITLMMWVDKLPTETADIEATLTPGVADAQLGILEKGKFEKIFNTESHFLTFGAYSSGAVDNWADDVMTVKAVTVYGADESAFATDITPPVITIGDRIESVYALNEAMNLPEATATEGTVKIYLINAEGTKTEISADYIPQNAGLYTLVYEAVDAKGNYGYKKYSIRLAAKDTVPPVLELSSESDITTNVNESFTLPTATATDDKDGDLSANIKVDIIGADSESDIWGSGVLTEWSIMSVGEHYIVYTVEDSFGNVTSKRVKVIVGGSKTGDLISEVPGYSATDKSVSINNSYMQYAQQKVLNEKVSIILNVSNDSGLLFINYAGDIGSNHDWPGGMVMRFVNGAIQVSALGHDKLIYGYFPNPYNDPYNKNWDTLFEYQLTKETIGGQEYIRIRLWFCGTELIPNNTANGGVIYTTLVENAVGYGVALPMSVVDEKAPGNYKSTFPHINSVNGFACEIKGLRIDGQAFPEGSWSNPDTSRNLGLEVPTFSNESAKLNDTGASATVTSGDAAAGGVAQPDSCKTVITASKVESQTAEKITLERINFSLQFVADENGSVNFEKHVKLMLLGAKPDSIWINNFGLEIYKSSSGNWIKITNSSGGESAYVDSENDQDCKDLLAALAAGNKVWLGYQLVYNLENGAVKSVDLKLWFSLDGTAWKQVKMYYPNANTVISADGYTCTISSKELTAAGIVSNGVHMSIYGNTDNGAAEAGFHAVIGDVTVGDPTQN